mmetsp:Transcript_3558/g.7800  ORF Transcript_3558/g.7800 Transcript_3558/m.7800 type:complete len:270 (+) Transcript_3558:585-1394(+)
MRSKLGRKPKRSMPLPSQPQVSLSSKTISSQQPAVGELPRRQVPAPLPPAALGDRQGQPLLAPAGQAAHANIPLLLRTPPPGKHPLHRRQKRDRGHTTQGHPPSSSILLQERSLCRLRRAHQLAATRRMMHRHQVHQHHGGSTPLLPPSRKQRRQLIPALEAERKLAAVAVAKHQRARQCHPEGRRIGEMVRALLAVAGLRALQRGRQKMCPSGLAHRLPKILLQRLTKSWIRLGARTWTLGGGISKRCCSGGILTRTQARMRQRSFAI